MQLKKYLLIAILLIVILTSCHHNENFSNKKDNYNLINVKYNYTIKGESSDDFLQLILNNPIDLKRKEFLENYDGSCHMIKEISSKYEEFWFTEIEVAYSKLLRLLDKQDRQSLINSQTSWESYMENKKNIEKSFYNDCKYNTLGKLKEALIIAENAEQTKARAYSLLEYLYIITGEINMVFSSNDW